MKLILNRIKTPDGTILTSKYTHDFIMYEDKNGKSYGVDGGMSYAKRIGDTNECEDLSVYVDEDTIEEKYEALRDTLAESINWGSRGINGDEPVRWLKITEMSDGHLDALVNVYKGPVDAFYKKCFKYEIEYRKTHNIIVND